jgi:hypothetical protein
MASETKEKATPNAACVAELVLSTEGVRNCIGDCGDLDGWDYLGEEVGDMAVRMTTRSLACEARHGAEHGNFRVMPYGSGTA